MVDNIWTYDKLWNKAKVYMQRALAEDREGELFPFWCAISLEFILRATLAKVHPALLADPSSGDNLLYVFGHIRSAKHVPISIPTKTVLERCEAIVPNFTEIEKNFCKEMTIRRNEEIHSGGLGFDGFSNNKWLSKYYRTLKIILSFHEKNLDELIGRDEVEAANEMISEKEKDLLKKVLDRISFHKKEYEKLENEKQNERIALSMLSKQRKVGLYGKEQQCPACSNMGLFDGKLISSSDGKATESEIVMNINVLPISFSCDCCGLSLANHLELDAVDLGGQYKLEEKYSPQEYYDLGAYEPDFDYGND